MEMNHVLVVEDDKEIREGVKIYLKSQGYEVYRGCGWDRGVESTGKRGDPSGDRGYYDAETGRNTDDDEIKGKV